MAMIRRITEINGEIIVVETMIIVGEIVLITVQFILMESQLSMKYYLLDSYGKIVRSFRSWSEANKFRIVMNRLDWRIVP